MATRRRGRPAHPDVLTPTEWAVLDQWRHGLSRAEIARRRAISAYGVRYHLRNIADKLGVVSSAELRHWRGAPMTSPLRRPVAATTTATATDRANDRTNPATSERSPSMSMSVPTADDGRAIPLVRANQFVEKVRFAGGDAGDKLLFPFGRCRHACAQGSLRIHLLRVRMRPKVTRVLRVGEPACLGKPLPIRRITGNMEHPRGGALSIARAMHRPLQDSRAIWGAHPRRCSREGPYL